MTHSNLSLAFIAGLSALVMSACSPAATSPDTTASNTKVAETTKTMTETMPATVRTKTKAVLIYADWCGSCKILDPKIEAVKSAHRMPGLEFVKLDYTDKNPVNFYEQAKAAGVEKAVKDYFNGTIKTGQLLMVDVNSKTVISKVTKEKSRPEIVSALKEAIDAS